MKRLLLIAFSAFWASQTASAQTISDALRYAYIQPIGTARYLATGGAMGALGADFSTLSANPAGVGLFRKNELVLGPSLRFSASEAGLRGSGNGTFSDDKSNFNFNSIGIVFNTTPRASRWQTFNVGIGYNKLANFNNAIFYEGKTPGTILNRFFTDARPTLDAGGSTADLYPFAEQLAAYGNAIYQQDGKWTYDFSGAENAVINRNQALVSSGSANEMVVSFGGNYEDKLTVGATVGVPFVKYSLEGTYEESNNDGAVPYFDNLKYTEYLRTNGIGVNLKMGVIYKVNQMFRIGAAFHTPTMMSLTDNYENSFQYAYADSSGTYPGELQISPNGTSDYRLRTPWRAILGGTVVIGRFHYLSADLEWVDYSAGRFNLTADVNNSENQAADSTG